MNQIDEYLNKVSEPEKLELEKIRKTVHELLPEAEETISYGMPGFKYNGKYLLGFAAFRDHLSLFPTSVPVEELKEKLADFKLSKGTIQFTPEKPIPKDILKEIIISSKNRILGD